MSKTLYELALEHEKEIPVIEEKIKDCKARRKQLRKGGLVLPNAADKYFALDKLISIYTDEKNELLDKVRTLKNYYKKEG